MFNNLRDYEYTRTGEEALGFYIVYTAGLLALPLILGPLMAASGALGRTPQQVAVAGGIAGRIIAMAYCGGLAFFVMRAKGNWTWHSWLLMVLAMVAVVIPQTGGTLGPAIVAYMTTRPLGWMRKVRRRKAGPRPAPQTALKPASPEAPASVAAEAPVEMSAEDILVAELEKAAQRPAPKTKRVRPDLDS